MGWMPYVVGINRGDPTGARIGKPPVSRTRNAPIGLGEEARPRFAGTEMAGNVGGCVGRPVIHYDEFPVMIGLRNDGGERFTNCRGGIVGGHDNRHCRRPLVNQLPFPQLCPRGGSTTMHAY